MTKKYKFDCSNYDRHGNKVSGPNHEINSVVIQLYAIMDRAGEGYYISFGTDGKFFFTEGQAKYLPDYWSQDAIIKMAEQWSDHGRNLDVEQCSHTGCRNDVGIELIEDESE